MSVVTITMNRMSVEALKNVCRKHNFSKVTISQNTKISNHRYYVSKAMRYLNINCQMGIYNTVLHNSTRKTKRLNNIPTLLKRPKSISVSSASDNCVFEPQEILLAKVGNNNRSCSKS